MEMNVSGEKGAIPKRSGREPKIKKQLSSPPYLEVPIDGELETYMKNTQYNSRRSLHDEVLRSAMSLKQSLSVPVCSNLRRHSCNDTDAILDRISPLTMTPKRRGSQVKRSASAVSSRSRRGSKYYNGVERRASNVSRTKNNDFALMIEPNKFPDPEAFRKEMRRRRIVWLVIGMFFFILTVSVLIVVITLTHRMDTYDHRRHNRSHCPS